MNKTFTFKKTYSNNESIKLNLISEINQHIGALSIGGEDFQVEIKPYSKRSMNALAAYMALIDSIVEWDKDNYGYSKKVWDAWFKKKAGLTELIDMIPLYEMEYQDLIKKGWFLTHQAVFDEDGEWYNNHAHPILILQNPDYKFPYPPNINPKDHDENWIYVADDSREIRLRSLSNKGDVTKEEMTRLLHEVLEFGAQNQVPNCFIPDDELDRLLKFSRGFRDD